MSYGSNSFADGNSMSLGNGNTYGTRDGSRPASAAWGLFSGEPVWRI